MGDNLENVGKNAAHGIGGFLGSLKRDKSKDKDMNKDEKKKDKKKFGIF